MVKIISPAEHLSRYILRYWAMESDGNAEEVLVYPEGYPELIYHFGEPFAARQVGSDIVRNQSIGVFCAQKLKSQIVSSCETSSMIAITFKPFGAAAFFGFDHSEIANSNIDIRDIFGDCHNLFIEQLAETRGIEAKVALIEDFYSRLIIKKEQDLLIAERGINAIIKSRGQISIEQAAKEAYISTRQFERIISRTVGVSPAKFSGIIKINHSIKLMSQNSDKSLTQIAFDSGYYDQSHFIKYFKEYIGISPKAFRIEL